MNRSLNRRVAELEGRRPTDPLTVRRVTLWPGQPVPVAEPGEHLIIRRIVRSGETA